MPRRKIDWVSYFSFYEETEWIRASLAWFTLSDFGLWRTATQKTSEKEKEEGCFGRGVQTHMLNALISLTLIIIIFAFFSRSSLFFSWSVFCILFSQLGLIYDNLVNAFGKNIGEGQNLRLLSKGRFLFHVVGIPLLTIPVTEVGVSQGVLGADTQSAMTSVALFWAVFEFFHWLSFDINQLKLVDLRGCKDHKAPYLAGTLAYTSGKFLELVLPCVWLIFYELAVGSCILWNDPSSSFRVGLLLATSALMTLLSCTIPGRPDIQLYGENFHGGMILVALVVPLV